MSCKVKRINTREALYTQHNPRITMVPRYLVIMLPILADFAAAVTSVPLGLISKLSADAGGCSSCPTGSCCPYATPNCCTGAWLLPRFHLRVADTALTDATGTVTTGCCALEYKWPNTWTSYRCWLDCLVYTAALLTANQVAAPMGTTTQKHLLMMRRLLILGCNDFTLKEHGGEH